MTTFAELQLWHFMIICNGLTSGYAHYNSVFEKRNESADGECQKIPRGTNQKPVFLGGPAKTSVEL